jgi:hypothetical protein
MAQDRLKNVLSDYVLLLTLAVVIVYLWGI